MIIVKLWGGLCNQMFQYAFGYTQSQLRKDQVRFDVEFYKNQPSYISSRELDLCKYFAIPNFEIEQRPKFVKPFQNIIVSNVTRRLNNFHCCLPGNVVYVREKAHQYINDPFYSVSMINYYDGYWQSEKYFEKMSDEIRGIFSFSDETKKKVLSWFTTFGENNLIAIHIRRGDMSKGVNKDNKERDIIYYQNAMKTISNRISNPVFVVFSDDIQWCKETFGDSNAHIVYQDQKWTALEDLCGISMCNHGIMSRSTFSWWGNWLGNQDGRIVIAPKGITFNDEFLPDRWETCD